MKGFMSEFKQFAMRGNVVDMAVGIIIGVAFGKIVSSLVADVIMPPLNMVMGKVDLSGLSVTIREASEGVEAVVINYGPFLQSVLDFVIVAFVIFCVIKGMNSMKKKEEAKPEAKATLSKEAQLLAEIRDALTSGSKPAAKASSAKKAPAKKATAKKKTATAAKKTTAVKKAPAKKAATKKTAAKKTTTKKK